VSRKAPAARDLSSRDATRNREQEGIEIGFCLVQYRAETVIAIASVIAKAAAEL